MVPYACKTWIFHLPYKRKARKCVTMTYFPRSWSIDHLGQSQNMPFSVLIIWWFYYIWYYDYVLQHAGGAIFQSRIWHLLSVPNNVLSQIASPEVPEMLGRDGINILCRAYNLCVWVCLSYNLQMCKCKRQKQWPEADIRCASEDIQLV